MGFLRLGRLWSEPLPHPRGGPPPVHPRPSGIWVLGLCLATSNGHRTMRADGVGESVRESAGSCLAGGIGEEAFS